MKRSTYFMLLACLMMLVLSACTLSLVPDIPPLPGDLYSQELQQERQIDWRNLLTGVLGLVMVLLLVKRWRRQWRDNSAPPISEEAEAIMDEIIDLDDAYHSGKVDEEMYYQTRAAIKARLTKMIEEAPD